MPLAADIRSAATLLEGSLGKLTQPLVIGDRGLACATSRGNILWNNASSDYSWPRINNHHLRPVTFVQAIAPSSRGVISLGARFVLDRIMLENSR